jgi:prepilin-type N-terminal cleavage/methylation domain-containing protein/prepilin-type processing-associated H-X9-DG protein
MRGIPWLLRWEWGRNVPPEDRRSNAGRNRAGRRSGWTLVELMCVIAVLAILAALLLPVLLSARARGYGAACTNNLRQLGQAVRVYCQDYDETFPPNGVSYFHELADLDRLWIHPLRPYFRDPRVLHCPADNIRNARRTFSDALPDQQDRADVPALSYGANWDLMDAAARGEPQACVAALPYPAQTLCVADCTEPWAFGPVYIDKNGIRWSHIAYANGPPVFDAPDLYHHGGRSGMGHERHGASSNVAFMDGHVAFIPADRFYRDWVTLPGSRRKLSVQWPLVSPGALLPDGR